MTGINPEGFTITGGKGFHMTFANGWSVSVQFGPSNYCEHKHDRSFRSIPDGHHSMDAEVAVLRPDGKMARLGTGGTVQGWLSPDRVARLLTAVSSGTFVEAVTVETN